jgi:hypothetical protein
MNQKKCSSSYFFEAQIKEAFTGGVTALTRVM